MEVFELSGVGDQERIGIEGLSLDDYGRLGFLNPDEGIDPAVDARREAAEKWRPIRLKAVRGHDRRLRPYFMDAVGPGLLVPGCAMAVSDRARELLSESLLKEAVFLPVEISGAPLRYWLLYATEYFSELDREHSDFSEPYRSSTDRRLMLRRATFRASDELDRRMIFRVPSTSEFIAPDITYATDAFRQLVQELGLGGFTFVRILAGDKRLAEGERRAIVSEGPRYDPPTELPPPAS